MPVECLALEDAFRKTLITEVAGVRGQAVLLPKSIYHASRASYGHLQPSDKGHLLVGGHKLKIERIAWRDGDLLHFVGGPPPKRGEKVLAHLDWPRRHTLMRAHAAAHVLESVVHRERRGSFVTRIEVLNGGGVKATMSLAMRGPKGVADVLARVNALVGDKLPIAAKWVPRDEALRHATSALPDSLGGEAVVRLVKTGDVSCVACDAPTLRDTRDVGKLVAADVLEKREGTRVVFKLAEA